MILGTDVQVWRVSIIPESQARRHVICTARGSERAKTIAHSHLKGDPDHYVVEPLTHCGDIVHFSLTI